MHFFGLLLTLTATSSAIDIRGWTSDGCRGSFRACTGIDPRLCCIFSETSSSGRYSISVNAIPTSWRIGAEARTGGACRYIGTSASPASGRKDICMRYTNRGDRTGGYYYFPTLKRAADNSCPTEQPADGKCEASVKPNALGLEDGTMYDITGLTEEKIQELEEIAIAGATADAVPIEFKILSV
ncbi:hypothetical protein SNK03_007673 [Fusarium graminearum]|uniref:Chromosome 2, complete genome n=1 Tax=Gibberella zeae (strain ATCC MYA-4620 / CBS 123657 / FGSC 9075 / NRRL 31084 / PH-1) TaxID=229533 RepID=I1SAX9_GIBZE|nr:hypothetical protein FGSG_14010 [Fusarium graminearum PH-1]EYB21922.1 hypothetical protein FG05_14010 [Fusarium graminearum]ESU08276.1 hypothetical protein FGSG_14010 [Fusarium graminearum PH-1]KAI6760097.1 hypothetical protein HG531_013670 [Fusarium graminearum]PCD24035.1 hypothetical protein FGRA07_11478 [Fusarium graminearum]CAF3443441.1 unnamed protein product [Fusarium graminearum]|eukprot:XP_011323120.1 hypothetical protein FGSG_14010 [Fusarium graminearum PH-1]